MQNAMDIMAMVQRTNLVKQNFDVPSKALSNEKVSFKKELNQARKAGFQDNISSTKDAERNTQRTTEKKIEKFAKVMSSNNTKAEINKEAPVDSLEQHAAVSETKGVVEETAQAEKPEEDVTEEATQQVLEMLQQMLQMMEGLKVDGVGNQNAAELKIELQAMVQQLEEAMAVTNQSGTSKELLNSLKGDLTELVKQFEAVDEYKLDPKQAEQFMKQFNDKLNQAESQLHQILQQQEKLSSKAEVAQPLTRQMVKPEINELNKTDFTTLQVKATDQNQQVEETDNAKTADAKDDKNSNESSSDNEGEGTYKASSYAEVKQTLVGDKPVSENPKDMVAPQSDKLDFQLNLKQVNSNLQKASYVKLNPTDIMNQVIKKADILVQGSHQEMIMKLEPESLGKLNLKLVVENGLITAKFIAESQQVKEVLESSFNHLKDALQEKGITVQGFSVSVGQEGAEFSSGQGFEQWKRTIKLNNRISGEYLGLDEENSIGKNPYSYHDGKVDYRA